MANELILAVDDEAHILELLSFNLEAGGYRVLTATTGRAVFQRASENCCAEWLTATKGYAQ